MTIAYYHPKLKTLSRRLRKEATLGERLLWLKLRGRQIHGYQFLRQKPIQGYIVDLFCKQLGLIIEIDGYSHEGNFEEDEIRQKKLESFGFTILRFSESEVRQDIEQVLNVIEGWIKERG